MNSIVNQRLAAILAIALSFSQVAFSELQGSSEVNSSTRISLPESADGKRAKVAFDLGTKFQSWKEGADNGLTTGFGIRGRLNYQVLSRLEAKASLTADARTGRVQDILGSDEISNIKINEALLDLKLINELSLQFGAINQESLESPLLVDEISFVGFAQDYQKQFSLGRFRVSAQQLVPSSKTLNSDRNVEEPMPYFFTQSLGLQTTEANVASAGFLFTRFTYNDLPSVVAAESSLAGNSVIGGSGPSSRFAEDFEGYSFSLNAQVKLIEQASVKFWGTWLENTITESESRHGQLLGSGLYLSFNDLTVEPKLEVFFKEADVVPASYSSSSLGYNNRQGYRASIEMQIPSSSLKAVLAYAKADTIFDTSTQNEFENYEIRIQFDDIKF